MITPRSDDQVGEAGAPDPLRALCISCLDDPDHQWTAIRDASRTQCGADDAGIVFDVTNGADCADGPLAAFSLAGIAERLRRPGEATTWSDGNSGHYFAATAIGVRDRPGLLWLRSAHPFDHKASDRLSSIGTLAALVRSMTAERERAELLLQESRHRAANDLQLINSLLSSRARAAQDGATASALEQMAARVMTLAHARQGPGGSLGAALQRMIAGLRGSVEDRGIVLHLVVAGDEPQLGERRIGLLTIAINELVTNAIKHGFRDRRAGLVDIGLDFAPDRLRASVGDDGWPIEGAREALREGSGLHLVDRLMRGAGGALALPITGAKTFMLDLPLAARSHQRTAEEGQS